MEVTKSFCMKKNRLFCLFILLVLVGGVSAQLVEKSVNSLPKKIR